MISKQRWAQNGGRVRTLGMAAVLAAGVFCASAQAQPGDKSAPEVNNLVNLSANGFLEVQQDWLTLRMTAERDGNEAAAVQSQLRTAIDSAMATARASAAPEQKLQVSNGAFGVYPRYDKNGKINGWHGSADLVMEGRDFARIAATAGKVQTMTVASMAFSLSREAQQKLESDVQALAIERFKTRAAEVAKGFGFTSFRLREIAVTSADQGESFEPRQRTAMMSMAKAPTGSAVPETLEPGMSKVNVSVSGTVQLQ